MQYGRNFWCLSSGQLFLLNIDLCFLAFGDFYFTGDMVLEFVYLFVGCFCSSYDFDLNCRGKLSVSGPSIFCLESYSRLSGGVLTSDTQNMVGIIAFCYLSPFASNARILA